MINAHESRALASTAEELVLRDIPVKSPLDISIVSHIYGQVRILNTEHVARISTKADYRI